VNGIGSPTLASVVLQETERELIDIIPAKSSNFFNIILKLSISLTNINKHNLIMESPDWKALYKEKCLDVIYIRNRCSKYRQAVEYALDYLKETGDAYHPALNITNLAEKSVWDKIKAKRSGSK
jgi:hypothetical protein